MVIDNGNTEIKSNIFSRVLFLWVQPLFTIGNKRPLTDEDVFPIDPRLQSERLTALLEKQCSKDSTEKKKTSLLLTLLRRHKLSLCWFFVGANIEAILRCLVPLFISEITSYFDVSTTGSMDTALYWAAGLVVLHFCQTTLRSVYFYHILRFGTSIRVAITGLIYRKACRITQREIGERSIGLIINLITNDAQRLDEYIVPSYVLMNIWTILPISFGIMYYKLGIYATIAGFASMLIFIPIQYNIGRFILYIRGKIAPLTDARIKNIHEIVSFMKIIKMYGWELMFQQLVEKIRLKETRLIGLFVLMRAMNSALLFISPVFSLMVVISVKQFVNEPLNTVDIFFYIAMVGILKVYLNIFLGHSFTFVPQIIHSLRRIQDFLDADEIQHIEKGAAITRLSNDVIINKKYLNPVNSHTNDNGVTDDKENVTECYGQALALENYTANWGGSDSFTIKSLNLEIKEGELIAVVGPVGCGKTTLLMSLIQELNLVEGSLSINGTVGFAAQVPWVFHGNIEDNIRFNRPLNKEKLTECIDNCYLTRDLELFSSGMYTLVGERGVALSGGQRARVSLARAVYGDHPIVLLDDPLSAVDSKCAKHIFNKLIKGQLRKKTRILVTHATHFLSEVDRVVVMDTDIIKEGNQTKTVGRISHVGTYHELVAQGLNLSMYGVGDKKKKRTLSRMSSISSDASVDGEDEDEEEEEEGVPDNKPQEIQEEKKTGSLDKMLYFKYLGMGLGYIALPILLACIVAPQTLDIYQQQYAINWKAYDEVHSVTTKAGLILNSTTPADLAAYDKHHYTVYVLLGVAAMVLYMTKNMFLIYLTNRSGRRLHNKALYSILRAPMRFFDTHPIGIIINRFSKDTYFMDERFPDVFLDFTGLAVLYIFTIGLILVANYWFILALIPLVAIMYMTIRYYLSTSIEIRRIEAVKRSPIMTHISSTLAGLTTIRANNQIDIYESKHYLSRDEHTRSWMLFHASSRWLALRLDSMAVVVILAATFLLISLRDQMGAKVAGLALVYVNNMTGGLQWMVRQYTETENMMTAIERVFSFTNLPPEAPLQNSTTTTASKYHVVTSSDNVTSTDSNVLTNRTTAERGIMEFRDVKLKYDPEGSDYVLHGLSFRTFPSEKIGIVGRTGAGKSTIIQALFRMVEPEGDILLDGMLTRDMGLHELRRSISIIPQESLLFSETLRVNLDPFTEFTDEEIWAVLEKVELRTYISAQKAGLELPVQDGGANLSAGQRQLLCLARALLRDNMFLVIDEATANVDEKTDHLIQETLKQRFANCTVLTIAHRINTIIDSDRILVMDAGRAVEIDHPAILLEDKDSVFYDLVKETGMFDILYEQAKKSLEKKMGSMDDEVEADSAAPFMDVDLI